MVTANELRRRNLQTLFNNTSVLPFKWRGKYLCFFCGIHKENYSDLKRHTRTHIPCSLTDRAMKLMKGQESETKIDVSNIICNVCSMSFVNTDDLLSHLITTHNLSYNRHVSLTLASYRLADLKCLVCGEYFKMFVNLVRHMNLEHPENCFQCDICHQNFNKKRDLSHHLRINHKDEYNCSKCSQQFSCFSKLLQHKMKEHSSSCNVCFQTFPTYQKRLSHMKREHDVEDGGECGFCNRKFYAKHTFLDHATKCKASQPKDETPIVIDEEERGQNLKDLRESIAHVINMTTAMPFKFFHSKFRCFYCPKDFTKCSDLRNHTTTEHPICDTTFKAMKLRGRSDGVKIKVDTSSLYCKICFERFDDFVNSVNHLEIEHKTVIKKCFDVFQPFSLIHDKFPCPFCSEEFRYFRLLLNHVSAGHSGNEYICTFCGKSFRTYPNLRAHVSRYHSTNSFVCSICNLGFPTANGLKLHMAKDHGTKVFNCQQCSDKFVSQYQMMRHILKVHDGGHKCSYCGLAFIKYSYKINHIRRLHLKEKNVQCALCNERFFDGNRLKLHMVRHVGERLFRCDHCGKKFLRKRNLRGHVALHLKNDSDCVTQS